MNSKQDNLSATTAIVHGAVIIFAYTSPWWLDWRIVTGGVLLYYIQIFVFKGCVLSLA